MDLKTVDWSRYQEIGQKKNREDLDRALENPREAAGLMVRANYEGMAVTLKIERKLTGSDDFSAAVIGFPERDQVSIKDLTINDKVRISKDQIESLDDSS